MIKKLLTIFCFLVLSFQLLPVRQLGSLLFKSGLTEELSHDSNSVEKDYKDQLTFKKDFLFSNHQFSYLTSEAALSQYIHFAAALPSQISGEIHLPPPNNRL